MAAEQLTLSVEEARLTGKTQADVFDIEFIQFSHVCSKAGGRTQKRIS